MISKIMSTPVAYATNFYANNCTPKKNSALNFNSGLKADTVSFSSKVNSIDEVVHKAFNKLAQNRKNNGLGTYLTTSNRVNIFLQETKLGKEAKLTLTDGILAINLMQTLIYQDLSVNMQKLHLQMVICQLKKLNQWL